MNCSTINENEISIIIKILNADKAQGWDNKFIRMIQLYGGEIVLPFQLLFKSMLEEDNLLEGWKKCSSSSQKRG